MLNFVRPIGAFPFADVVEGDLIQVLPEGSGVLSGDASLAKLARLFLNRLGNGLDGQIPQRVRAEDVGHLVAFLATGKSRHLTGATLDVNGATYVR